MQSQWNHACDIFNETNKVKLIPKSVDYLVQKHRNNNGVSVRRQ
jgi:hypothetical protein